jgi:endo-1,4-beta-xylanase
LIVEQYDVSLEIPLSIFANSDEEVTITIERLKDLEESLSGVYDFMIKQGDTIIREFDEPVTLVFKVDTGQINEPDHINVFNLNTEENVWELVGGTYADGAATAETNHFSTFTLFETAENQISHNRDDVRDDDSDRRDDNDGTNGRTDTTDSPSEDTGNSETGGTVSTGDKDADGKKLPSTSPNIFNLLLIGGILLILGAVVFVIRKRQQALVK